MYSEQMLFNSDNIKKGIRKALVKFEREDKTSAEF